MVFLVLYLTSVVNKSFLSFLKFFFFLSHPSSCCWCSHHMCHTRCSYGCDMQNYGSLALCCTVSKLSQTWVGAKNQVTSAWPCQLWTLLDWPVKKRRKQRTVPCRPPGSRGLYHLDHQEAGGLYHVDHTQLTTLSLLKTMYSFFSFWQVNPI